MNTVLPKTRHWSGCEESGTRTDERGRPRCLLCDCVVHPIASNACASLAETNEDRSMALVTPPGPLDANKERRNG